MNVIDSDAEVGSRFPRWIITTGGHTVNTPSGKEGGRRDRI